MSRRGDIGDIENVRGHTARGTILNSGYLVTLSALGLIQRLVAAAFMSAAEFGLWAVILTLIINFSWLKDVGIGDKFLQQSDEDQELAYQRAFTLELISSMVLFAIIAAVLPLWALAYGHEEVIVGGLVAAAVIPISVFQTATWIPYRRLQYGRQRLLSGVPVVVGFVVTVTLAIAGAGYWAFIVGALAGGVIGSAVCFFTLPYKLRLSYDKENTRSYVSFSWPLVAAGLSGLVFVQGSLLIVNHTVGLAGVGTIGFVIGIVAFAERVDTVVGQTIYPAVCAVADRRVLLEEIFVKSNRVALMWAIPFSVGVALFAGELITFVLGERWRLAEDLLVVVGLYVGLGQIFFNWAMFFRALDRTRPIFVSTLTHTVVFLAVLVPATQAYGLIGYGIAFGVATTIQIAQRAWYLGELFADFGMVRHPARSLVPVVPGVVLVLAVRAAAGSPTTLARALAELVLYAVVTITTTALLERRLVIELAGYMRRGSRRRPALA